MMEIDSPTTVMPEILNELANKTPKISVACMAIVKDGIKTFGIRHTPVKIVLKAVIPLLENANKDIRSESLALIVEICRWLGKDALSAQLETVKPAQMKELEEAFNKLPNEEAKPEKQLRSDLALDGEDTNDVEVEELDLEDAVNILEKVDENFYNNIVRIKKMLVI